MKNLKNELERIARAKHGHNVVLTLGAYLASKAGVAGHVVPLGRINCRFCGPQLGVVAGPGDKYRCPCCRVVTRRVRAGDAAPVPRVLL